MSAGKGDKPRNNFSKQFFTHFDEIDFSFKNCEKCGAKIYDYREKNRQMEDPSGATIYICDAHEFELN